MTLKVVRNSVYSTYQNIEGVILHFVYVLSLMYIIGVLWWFANVWVCPAWQCPTIGRGSWRQFGRVSNFLSIKACSFNRRHFQMPLSALWPNRRRRECVQPSHFLISSLQSPQRRGIRWRIRSFDSLQPIHSFFHHHTTHQYISLSIQWSLSSHRIRLRFSSLRAFLAK